VKPGKARRVAGASKNPAAVLPAVRPLPEIAVPLERALLARGFLPLALVGQPVDAARPDGEPAAVRDRIGPRHALDRRAGRALLLIPPYRGIVPRRVDEHRVLTHGHRPPRDGKNIYVLGAWRIAEQCVSCRDNDDVRFDHRG